jgi:hypothetical protein
VLHSPRAVHDSPAIQARRPVSSAAKPGSGRAVCHLPRIWLTTNGSPCEGPTARLGTGWKEPAAVQLPADTHDTMPGTSRAAPGTRDSR